MWKLWHWYRVMCEPLHDFTLVCIPNVLSHYRAIKLVLENHVFADALHGMNDAFVVDDTLV